MINTKYKDRLFRLLFGNEEYKENILSLYNALNGTDYKDVNDIEIYTIDDVIYIKMKNDSAIILDSHLSLWEQQSSKNPNMPLRGLLYFAKLYDKYIESNNLNIYGSKLIKIPTPKYVVFYNGKVDAQPVQNLKLSDAFLSKEETDGFEWTATVYNLNPGKNDHLLQNCKPLRDYMELVNQIRSNEAAGQSIEEAVDNAVMFCIEHGNLENVLLKHRAEVIDMCITEFNEAVFINGIKAEGIAEGIAEGRSKMTSELSKAIMDVKNGATEEDLKKSGYGDDIINLIRIWR